MGIDRLLERIADLEDDIRCRGYKIDELEEENRKAREELKQLWDQLRQLQAKEQATQDIAWRQMKI